MHLRFELRHRPDPAPNEPGAELKAWAELTVALLENDAREVLLRYEWHMDALIDWYLAHHAAIQSDLFPYVLDGESLAEASNRLNAVTFNDEAEADQWDAMLYRFRVAHCLAFALRGARIPWVFIGFNNGTGEISLHLEPDSVWHQMDEDYPGYFKPGSWAHSFDMDDFHLFLKAELKRFLDAWAGQSLTVATRERVEILRKQVEAL